MPPPASVFKQPGVSVTPVPAWSLVPSPRNYNASIAEFDGRRIMAYRSHRMDQGGRCGIVIAEMNDAHEAVSNTWLNLPEQAASVMLHHEDPRLFIFDGALHVAYTETQFHPRPRPYTCVMKYARLKAVSTYRKPRSPRSFVVDRVFWPRYGKNDGNAQEKNWQFFDDGGHLRIIYRAEPHEILTVGRDGEQIVGKWSAVREDGGVKWPWGEIRGGTPPVKMKDGNWLTFFHSSTPYAVPPHWRRYYAGAYVFSGVAPFHIIAISQRPLLTGSELDGHAYDPRDIDSWKPFVVFPSGVIVRGEQLLVSYGINDHSIAIADHRDLKLGDPTFKNWGPRYFLTENGNTPLRYWKREDAPPEFLRWDRVRTPPAAGVVSGVLAVHDPRIGLLLQEEAAGVEEISEEQFNALRAP